VKLNAKRGLNRVFIVLAAIWAVYCLFGYPFQKRIEAVKKHDADMTECYRAGHDEQKDCYDAVGRIYLNEVGQYQMPEYYKWSWPFLLILVVGLPTVVYLLSYSAIATLLWITRGFEAR
jgi:hypothetical protein